MLQNIRVLDLSRVLAGPLCGMILGDLGANVIKVERSATGDESRGWGPPFDDRGESAYYLSCNRNKLGVAADLDIDSDLGMIRRLALDADVVIDNFKPGTLEKRGLDPAELLSLAPSLIWCTITGFGWESARPGYDFVVQAESGWMAITGEPEGEPMKTGVALADVLSGKDAAIAILAALVARTSRPLAADQRWLTISLAHTATAALMNVAQNALVSGTASRRWGNAHANLVPYQLFRAADRSLVIAVGNDAQWRACCSVLALSDLRDDVRVATNSGRLQHRDQVVSAISGALTARPAGEWVERLTAAGVPSGVIRTPTEALAEVTASPLTGIHPLAPGAVRFPPPQLDQHGALVRAEGWSAFSRVASIG